MDSALPITTQQLGALRAEIASPTTASMRLEAASSITGADILGETMTERAIDIKINDL